VQGALGDSDHVASSANAAGRRSGLEVGNAAAAVARQARHKLREQAQPALEAHAEDILLRPSGAIVRGAPVRSVELSDLLGDGFEVQETFQSSGAYTGACHAVVVEVDPDTSSVDIVRYAIARDCGQAHNLL